MYILKIEVWKFFCISVFLYLNSQSLKKEMEISMDFLMRKDYQKIILYIITIVSVLLCIKYVLPYFLPLIIAVIIVVPIQKFCMKRNNIKKNGKGFMAGGVLFGFILIIALLIVGIVTFLLSRAREIAANADYIIENFISYLKDITYRMEDSIGIENGILISWLEKKSQGIGDKIAVESNMWISDSIKYMAGAGRVAVFLTFSFICVVLFAREIEEWQHGLLSIAAMEPAIDRLMAVLIRIGKKLGTMIRTYLKTQTVILICISVVASAGIYIAGIKDAYFYGILAGIMDFLPFIGTGIVMVPVGVVFFIQGKISSAIIILLTYLVCVVTREFLEPHLIGNGLKFSPVAVLIAVYAGVQFYGVMGVILGPVTLLIFVEIAKELFERKNDKKCS